MDIGIPELFIVCAIIVILVFSTALIGRVGLKLARGTGTLPQAPLEILKARYARGELTSEQYEQMKRELE